MSATVSLPWRVRGFASLAQSSPPAPTVAPRDDIEALRDRDPDAWHRLFEREMRAVFRYAYGRLGDVTRAEDATADVFESAWQNAESLRDHGLPARAWLFGIARNVIGTHWRRWFRQPPQLSLEAFQEPASDGSIDHERLDLAAAIARLDVAHSEVITLRFIHGLSLQEAAAALNVTVDAIKGRQARALAALRDSLSNGA